MSQWRELKNPRHICVEPKQQDSFGHLLWEIFDDEDLRYGARLLGLWRRQLLRVIWGQKTVTQTFVDQNEWRRKLAHDYPRKFNEHSAQFEKFYAMLPKNDAALLIDENIKRKANYSRKSAEEKRLNASQPAAQSPAPEILAKEIVAPKVEAPKIEVPKKIEAPKPPAPVKPRNFPAYIPKPKADEKPIVAAWREEASLFIREILKEREDEIKDILPDVMAGQLRTEEIWQQLEKNDITVSDRMFRLAIRELCHLYKLKPETESRDQYQKAVRILAKSNIPG